MVMRLREDPETDDGFFGVLNEGTVIRSNADHGNIAAIASGLPPAYDLAVIP
jgi:hypothetical protein